MASGQEFGNVHPRRPGEPDEIRRAVRERDFAGQMRTGVNTLSANRAARWAREPDAPETDSMSAALSAMPRMNAADAKSAAKSAITNDAGSLGALISGMSWSKMFSRR